MKVSIIVPVYNVEKYLEKCLTSLISQTFKEYEIIIVNDGSPDNSQKIIDKYKKKYPNLIKSFKIKNSGQGEARNIGVLKASGEYVMYVDSDDYIREDMVEKLYNEALKTKSEIVACGNYVVKEDYTIIKEELPYSYNDKNNVFLNLFFGKMAVWNKLYKRDLIVKNNIIFRSKLWYEDLDFTCKVIMTAKSYSIIEDSLYYYLLRPGSTMNNDNIKRNTEILDAFNNILDYSDKYRDEIEFLAIHHIYISAIVRIINANAKNKKEIIRELKKYIEVNFHNFKHNKYLYLLDKKKKLVYNLIMFNQYWIVKLLFKIKNVVM